MTGTGAGVRLPAEQRRSQLLDVALEVFSERGFNTTSMDDVAIAAGVTKPVLYQHFPSKRALYVELLTDTGDKMLAAMRAATSRAPTGRARVEGGFAAYFRFVTENRPAFRVLFGASVRNDPEFAEIASEILEHAADTVAPLIALDVPDAQRRALAHALVGMAEATSRWALADRDPDVDHDPDHLAAWLAEMAWFGLRGVRAPADERPPT